MFVFLIYAEEPLMEVCAQPAELHQGRHHDVQPTLLDAQAWGCYPQWYTADELNFGLCPAYLQKENPENALAPVCTAVPGAECLTEGQRWSAAINHATVVRHRVAPSLRAKTTG